MRLCEKHNNVTMVKTHLDALIAETMKLQPRLRPPDAGAVQGPPQHDHAANAWLAEHLIDSWQQYLSDHLTVRGRVTKHEHLRDLYAEWWAKDHRAEILHNALQPLTELDARQRGQEATPH